MARVPRLISEQNLASLPLTPAESFLASQIDATLSENDLVFVSGMTPVQVAATLDRLAHAGAIDFVVDARAPAPPPSVDRPKAPERTRSPHDPPELDEPVDLDLEKKRRILDLFGRLDDATYYDLLGVDAQGDKKQVKNAYYALAPEFHPDKYFRKNLGSFKAKIEAIFARLTLAHDVLSNAKRRQEYDEYLSTTHQNRAMSAMLEQTQREVAAVQEAVQKAAAAAVAAAGPPPASAPAPQPSSPGPSSDEMLRMRKEALARKLMGGAGAARRPGPAPAPTAAAPPRRPEMDPAIAARAAEALRLRHEAAVAEAKRAQVQRYIETGREALDRRDYAGAANAFRIAASLEPDDPKVQATCHEAMKLAAAALADGYWKQAVYEEGQERWAEAALSYSKVCMGRPEDAIAHERVAYTTLRSSANVRRSVDFARKAVELAPKSPEFRVTLARAYLAAGLEKSCNGELDRALELDPGNQRVQAMAAQVRAAAAAATNAPKDGKVS
ncbi:Tetratricopeptide repeat protein [Minicystis rosea]|nr:Tetratricopeptide repeat protein [Minicystis rosea]